MFLPLLSFGEDGELEGRLARSWEHSSDYSEVTYHLRSDLRWHDGTPVTAQDLEFSMELMTRPDVVEELPGFFGTITVIDDSTIMLRDAKGGTDEVFWPKHLLEHLDPKEFYDWDFWTHPVGNGPYRFVRYLPETMMELEANPDYYKGKPKIERVVLKFAGEDQLSELLSGNVDAITEANPAHIPKLARDPRFRVYYSYGAWWIQQALYWKNDHPILRDPRVRRALTLAIDRRQLLQVINLPDYTAIVDGPYTLRQLRRGLLPDPLPYDPGQASALLDAAGWQDEDGDGVRERDGQPLRFTAMVATGDSREQIAVFVQDQLRRVGVHMDVQLLPNINVVARLKTGDFEAALTSFVLNRLRLNSVVRVNLGYDDARLFELVDQSGTVWDPDRQDEIFSEITAIIRRDLPITFLFPRLRTVFAHRRIKGLSSPWRADPVRYLEDLWLEDDDAGQ